MAETYTYREWECTLSRGKYGNGRAALQLIGLDGIPVTKITVNLHDAPMEPDEVAVKDYSENEGMLKWAIQNGIVSEPLRLVASGRVFIPICRLLI